MSSKSPRNSSAAPAPDAKRRRNIITATVIALAVIGAAVLIIASSGGDSKPKASSGGSLSGTAESKQLLDGIPQQGNTLGNPKAPVTLFEYIDYQCPFCRQFSVGPLRTLIKDYVRPGKVKIVLRPLSFIGPDSAKAARAAVGAGQQDKLWTFTELWYFNQGQENSGYATDEFVGRIYAAAGVKAAAANAYRKTEASKRPLAAANSGAQQYAVDSTPSFVAGATGGPYAKVDADAASPDKLRAAFDGLLP